MRGAALVIWAGMAVAPVARAEPLQPCPAGQTPRERLCLRGPVRTVSSRVARYVRVDGAWVETEPTPSWIDPAAAFDRAGHLAERTEYAPDGSLRSESVYVYDSLGRHREIISFNADGALLTRTVLVHDGRGRKTGEKRFDADGALRVRVAFAYDVLGNLIEETLYNGEDAFMLRWVYSYDSAGHRTREAVYTPKHIVMPGPVSRTYAYGDAAGPVEELAFDANGTLLERTTAEYDADGNRVAERRYTSEGFLLGTTVYTYKYDAAGNWVKRTRSKKFGNLSVRPVDVTYRTVTYFEGPTALIPRRPGARVRRDPARP